MTEWIVILFLAILLVIILVFWWGVVKIIQSIVKYVKNPWVALILIIIVLWFVFG